MAKKKSLVKDYMTENPARMFQTDSVQDALQILDVDRFRHLPIVDSNGNAVGMISDRDLLPYTTRRLGQDEFPVSKIMSAPIQSISRDEELVEAASRMLEYNVGALPVVHDEKLIGIISYVDVLRAFIDKN